MKPENLSADDFGQMMANWNRSRVMQNLRQIVLPRNAEKKFEKNVSIIKRNTGIVYTFNIDK